MRAAVEAIYHWVSFPDVCRRWGESERQLSLLPCPAVILLSQQTAVQGGEKKAAESKGQITSSPQTFGLMSKWGSVVISASSPQRPRFPLSRATCSRAGPWCDPACTDSSGGTANPFICCRSSYLPHGDGWEEPAPLRPAQTPWGGRGGGRDIPCQTPPSVHKHNTWGRWRGEGLQKTSCLKNPRQI